jgi:hypothetical protein
MSRQKTKLQSVAQPPQIRADAAGIDISPEVIYVAVDPRKDAKPIRHYGSVTAESYRIANWLKARGVRTGPWSPPGCIGFPCTRFSMNWDSRYIWSTRATSYFLAQK